MELVIEHLEKEIQSEEMYRLWNKRERENRKLPITYKGPEMQSENPEYLDQLKKAISILKNHK